MVSNYSELTQSVGAAKYLEAAITRSRFQLFRIDPIGGGGSIRPIKTSTKVSNYSELTQSVGILFAGSDCLPPVFPIIPN